MTDMPPIVESSAVQLARMEGKIDRVFDRVDDLRNHVAKHDTRLGGIDEKIDQHDSRIQSLEEGVVAGHKQREELAAKLKEQREEETRAAEKAWSPIQRIALLIGVALTLLEIYQHVILGNWAGTN